MKLVELYRAITEKQGFTIDHELNTVESKGYAVSYDNETKIPVSKLSLELLQGILEYYQSISTGAYIGAWLDGETVYFDVTQITDDLNTAIKLGHHYKQLAIFDLNEKNVIRL